MKNIFTIMIIAINVIALVVLVQLASFDEMSNTLSNGGLVKGHPNQYATIPILAIVASFCLNVYLFLKLRNSKIATR